MRQRQWLRIVSGFALLSLFEAGSLCLAAGAGPEELQNRPEKIQFPPPAATAHLDFSAGVPVVSVTINEHLTIKVRIDTGSYASRFDKHLVQRLGLGPVESGYVRIDSLGLAGAVFTGVKVKVVEAATDSVDGAKKYSGSLGLSLFADCLLSLDFPRSQLSIRRGDLPAADGQGILDYKNSGGLVTFPLSVGGVATEFILDTGSRQAFTLAKSLRGKVKVTTRSPLAPKKNIYFTDVDLAEPILPGTVSIGSHRLIECPVTFHDGPSNLGSNVLKHFLVTIDQKNRRVLIGRNWKAPISLVVRSRFGLVFERQGRALIVVHVFPESTAEASVVKVGDSVIELGRRGVLDLSNKALRSLLREAEYIVLKIDYSGVHLLVGLDAAG